MTPAHLHVNRLSWKDIGNRDDKMRRDFFLEIQKIQLDAAKWGAEQVTNIISVQARTEHEEAYLKEVGANFYNTLTIENYLNEHSTKNQRRGERGGGI